MAKQCIQCGHDNDDSALRCVCGSELPAEVAVAAVAAAEPAPRSPAPLNEPSLLLRRVAILVWAIGFVPLFAWAHSLLKLAPGYRVLVGTGVFYLSAAVALWLLGREKRRALRIWRTVFVVWALLLVPLLLDVAQGIAAEGWPRGRLNRQVAEILVLILVLTVPGYLTGLLALVRTYRLASAFAFLTGVAYLVNSVYLFRATAPAHGLRLQFLEVLDIILFGAQMGSYLSIPVGIALIVGGIMTFLGARARPPSGES